jgi:hypothetical protein
VLYLSGAGGNAYLQESSGTVFIGAGGAGRVQVTSTGNLGLGVTPSAWDTYKSLELPAQGYVSSGESWMELMYNTYYASGSYRYKANGFASHYLQQNGAHSWYTAASGTAGNAITFTQAMTLDASGRLGIGATSPSNKLVLREAGATSVYLQFLNNSDANGGYIGNTSGGDLAVQTNNAMIFYTGSSYTERARITSGGYFKASNDGTYLGSTASYHELRNDVDGNAAVVFSHDGASGQQYGLYVKTTNDQNDNTRYFLYCEGATTERATIRSNGGLANYSANNVNLASDERLKKDIAPLASTWDKLKAMEVVNFRYKDCNDGDPALYGVIAQQVQPIVPELVVVTREAVEAKDAVLDEDGNEVEPAVEAAPEYYGIREQPMYWLAIKALQEAMARIESLEARLAALEN